MKKILLSLSFLSLVAAEDEGSSINRKRSLVDEGREGVKRVETEPGLSVMTCEGEEMVIPASLQQACSCLLSLDADDGAHKPVIPAKRMILNMLLKYHKDKGALESINYTEQERCRNLADVVNCADFLGYNGLKELERYLFSKIRYKDILLKKEIIDALAPEAASYLKYLTVDPHVLLQAGYLQLLNKRRLHYEFVKRIIVLHEDSNYFFKITHHPWGVPEVGLIDKRTMQQQCSIPIPAGFQKVQLFIAHDDSFFCLAFQDLSHNYYCKAYDTKGALLLDVKNGLYLITGTSIVVKQASQGGYELIDVKNPLNIVHLQESDQLPQDCRHYCTENKVVIKSPLKISVWGLDGTLKYSKPFLQGDMVSVVNLKTSLLLSARRLSGCRPLFCGDMLNIEATLLEHDGYHTMGTIQCEYVLVSEDGDYVLTKSESSKSDKYVWVLYKIHNKDMKRIMVFFDAVDCFFSPQSNYVFVRYDKDSDLCVYDSRFGKTIYSVPHSAAQESVQFFKNNKDFFLVNSQTAGKQSLVRLIDGKVFIRNAVDRICALDRMLAHHDFILIRNEFDKKPKIDIYRKDGMLYKFGLPKTVVQQAKTSQCAIQELFFDGVMKIAEERQVAQQAAQGAAAGAGPAPAD